MSALAVPCAFGLRRMPSLRCQLVFFRNGTR